MKEHTVSFALFLSSLLTMAKAAEDNSQYLYLKMDADQRYPVKEFRVGDTTKEAEPFFLSENYPNPRVVEFYAHWCPHCMHFKPQYIQFARKITEVTIDLVNTPTIEVFAVSCVPFDKICKHQQIQGYPTFQLYPPHSANGTRIERNQLHPLNVLRRFGFSATDYKEPTKDTAPVAAHQVHNDPNDPNAPYFMDRSKEQVFQDAHLSFDFAMRNGVFVTNNALDSKTQKALKEFLFLVQKTFPTTSSIQPVVDVLINDFDKVAQSDLNLVLAMDKHPPPTSTWSPACLQHGTGYTCGLWQLFHIITIGMVEWNKMAPNSNYQLVPTQVADAIRDYVEHFFQCEECRMHFMHAYDSCAHDRCNRLISYAGKGSDVEQWRELPLWLYETHNGVNARLRKERIERHDEEPDATMSLEVLWPPRDSCQSCWLSEGRWEDNSVYEFLRLQYW
jgi:thiol-disulfide isomerase/thioredoxin